MTTGSGYGQSNRYGQPGYGYPGQGGPAYVGPGYPGPVAGRAQMRAADADRERAVDFLKRAFTEGRLTKDDYDHRVGKALAATTYADLDYVMADLPAAIVPVMPRPPQTNGLAIASLCCGLGQLVAGPLATVPAIVLGHVARNQIRRTGEQGSGLALAGLLLGWAGVVFMVVVFLGIMLLVAAVAHTGGAGAGPQPMPGP
jgi:hypothetical protein